MPASGKRWWIGVLVAGLVAAPTWAEDVDKIVHLRLRGELVEAPPEFELDLFGGEKQQSLFDLVRTLRKARTDDEVRALIVDLDEAKPGISQIEELRAQFAALRAADKDVWVYTAEPTLGTLYLASAASKVVIMPRGEDLVIGMYASPMYFKGLLDKIGASADVVHCGEYKAAGEPFSRTGPSKEAESDINKIMDGIFDGIVSGIARSRKLTPQQVRDFIDSGPHSAQEMLDAGMVDELKYRQDFLKSVRKKFGRDAKIVHDYGAKKGPEIDFKDPFAFFKLFGEIAQAGKKKTDENLIAVVYVDAAIVTGSSANGFSSFSGSDTVRKAIDDAAKDENVRALVLRVDSPGGSAVASEIIAESAKRCKGQKPFIVSMGDVAASGGYYVSCLADRIFAQPGTITGSIGVIGVKIVTKGTWDKLGISFHEYQRGKAADMLSGLKPWTGDNRERITKMMNRVYGEFKGRVEEGRGKKLSKEIEALAGGRIYTGEQARAAGLIDEIGGFDDAIRYAADQAGVSKYELKIFPEQKNIMDMLAESLGMREKDEDDLSIRRSPEVALAQLPMVQAAIASLAAIDPAGAVELRHQLSTLQALSRDRVLMVAPPLPRIR